MLRKKPICWPFVIQLWILCAVGLGLSFVADKHHWVIFIAVPFVMIGGVFSYCAITIPGYEDDGN